MTVNYVRWLRSYVGHQRLLQLAASAYITDDRGHVLLGRRSDVMLWAPPSGVVQLGETPAQTLVREVQEETGLHVAVERLIGLYTGRDFEWTYPNGDQAQIVSAFFACRVLGGVLTPDYSEFVSLSYYPPQQLPPLMPRYVRMLRDAIAGRREAAFD
ncbi:MAG TPA: NUDIX domain-containing protein [Roseiflexaceae bacterium]|nr:NUDIX domain-containing protein [Roseiflexaceae bacterium]